MHEHMYILIIYDCVFIHNFTSIAIAVNVCKVSYCNITPLHTVVYNTLQNNVK